MQYTGGESGANTALPAWIDYMAVALPLVSTEHQRLLPEGVVNVRIDTASGLRSERVDFSSQFEYFIAGTEPTQFATPSNVVIDKDGTVPNMPDDEEIF